MLPFGPEHFVLSPAVPVESVHKLVSSGKRPVPVSSRSELQETSQFQLVPVMSQYRSELVPERDQFPLSSRSELQETSHFQ
jgi:hypothetical protein